jgi:hypothetical protein
MLEQYRTQTELFEALKVAADQDPIYRIMVQLKDGRSWHGELNAAYPDGLSLIEDHTGARRELTATELKSAYRPTPRHGREWAIAMAAVVLFMVWIPVSAWADAHNNAWVSWGSNAVLIVGFLFVEFGPPRRFLRDWVTRWLLVYQARDA